MSSAALGCGLSCSRNFSCCIDKASTAELSEAINSMFRCYERSKACYAYLADVSTGTQAEEPAESSFASSNWFTRGWTLQELIAPRVLIFFSREWKLLGTKKELSSVLSGITRIDHMYLTTQHRSWHFSIIRPPTAEVMSWAAGRSTTRIEDRAYCLLGLFDINMPLLYGDGKKSFSPLQEELLRCSYDQSLFAWGSSLARLCSI